MNRRIYACLNKMIVTSIIIHRSTASQLTHNYNNVTLNERPQIGAKDYRWLGFRHVLVGSVELCLKVVLHRPSLCDIVVAVVVAVVVPVPLRQCQVS